MSRFAFTAEDLESMTAEERDAILDALAVADGGAEPDRFNAEVGSIPWGRSMDEVARMAQSARARVMALRTDAERLAALRSVAARLPSPAIKEKVLAMMARVVTDRGVLAVLAVAFGVEADRVAEMSMPPARG